MPRPHPSAKQSPVAKWQLFFSSLLAAVCITLAASTSTSIAQDVDGGRQTLGFNQGWRFFRPADGSAAVHDSTNDSMSVLQFDDAGWDRVTLPHTVRLEPFDASGGRNYQGICWYRRHFQPEDSWKDHKLLLRFGAAMQVADVWLNGRKLSTHYGGYIPFTIDITSAVNFGTDNVLVVRLDNSDNPQVPPGKPQDQLDFSYFGGLYRDVDLVVTDRLHVSDVMLANKPGGGGVFVTFPSVNSTSATVHIQTDVINEYLDARNTAVTEEIVDSSGAVVATQSTDLKIAPGDSQVAVQDLKVASPKLWHPNHPFLYTLRTMVIQNGKPVDTVSTRIGIRTFKFDAQAGLSINGEKFVSIGANRHQDHPYVGYALSDQAQWRDVKKLREAGFTSIRSHYPQSPAFVDACDELGMLLIVSNPGWQFHTVGDTVFEQRVYQDARDMIRRDRNHPSVILWEAQLNESNNGTLFSTLQKIVHEEFPFDPCYSSGDSIGGQGGANWDVVYGRGGGASAKPTWIREIGDSVDNWTDQQSRSRVARSFGETAMLVQAWSHLAVYDAALKNTSVGGIDLWAGVDAYRGYHHQPFLGGPLDLFRIPKFDFYMFASQRPPDIHVPGLNDGPMVFIANYATFQSPTNVTVFSNCEQVRLLQASGGGRARGGGAPTTQPALREVAIQKPMDGYTGLPHAPFSFKVGQFSQDQTTMFMTGVAQPGTSIGQLRAEGLIGGKVVATHEIRAPGVATSLRLEADTCGKELLADGSDWIRVYAYVCDNRGTTHPYANDEVSFTVNGQGQIIDDSRIHANPVRAEAGIATILVRSTALAGPIIIHAEAFGLKSAEITIESKPSMNPIVP